jgi:hypothetical protein
MVVFPEIQIFTVNFKRGGGVRISRPPGDAHVSFKCDLVFARMLRVSHDTCMSSVTRDLTLGQDCKHDKNMLLKKTY